MRYFEKVSESTAKQKISDAAGEAVKKGKKIAGDVADTAGKVAGKGKEYASKAFNAAKANPKTTAGIGAGVAAAAAAGGMAYKSLKKKTLVEKAVRYAKKNPLVAGAAALGAAGVGTAAAVGMSKKSEVDDRIADLVQDVKQVLAG